MKKNEKLIKNIIVMVLMLITVWFGFRPIITGNANKGYTRLGSKNYTFEENEYATIVIGSEPEGVASALASARTGLKTLLITKDQDLGSYITKSLISRMEPQQGLIGKKKVPLNQGVYQEIFGKTTVAFSSDNYIETVTKLVKSEKKLDIIYESYLSEVDREGEKLKGIYVVQPDGKHYYKAHNFIDATQNGELLMLSETPYITGSEDMGIPGIFEPLEFNFRISGVDVEALKKSRKVSDFADEFTMALLNYKKINPNTKLVSPSFLSLSDEELVITGLTVFGVNVENEDAIKSAFLEAEDEARMLTAYLKTVIVAFKNSTYAGGPETFFVPEFRHFEGRYRLTVSDILENRDFKDKVSLSSAPVNAGKFVNEDIKYIVTKPNVYAIPLGSIIPVNLENVLMTGAKASYTSLAATSAGSLPTRITVGEAAGYVAAYSYISNISPYEIWKGTGKELETLKSYIKRGGVVLEDFSESLMIPKTQDRLKDHWAYNYVATLAEYGLIAGGEENDYKLDYKSSQELFAVLLKNTVLKLKSEKYDMNFDRKMRTYEVQEPLVGETAAAMVLDALSVSYEKGGALKVLKEKNLLPKNITDRLLFSEPVTMDVVYGLSVETTNAF